MDDKKLKNILEAGLLVAGRTLSIAQLEALFQHDEEKPERKQIREALEALKADYEGRGIELVEVASGFRLQSHSSVSDWVANLFQEKPPRYSRALLETLVLIAYRQPITRAEIEDVRGVAVSSNIIKTLQERRWVKVLGHKEVPGRPALLGTSKEFLDYFNLKKLDDLPALADIKDLDQFDELLAEEAGNVDESEVELDGDENSNSAGDANTEASGTNTGVAASDSDNADAGVNGSGGEGLLINGSGLTSGALLANVDTAKDIDAGDNATNGLAEDEASADSSAPEGNGKASDSDESSDDAASASADVDADQLNGDEGKDADSGDSQSSPSEGNDFKGSDSEGSDSEGSDANLQADENTDIDDADEALSQPERDLMQVIANFSQEHQEEVDARDEMEDRILSKNADDDTPDVSDLSQRISDDGSGDMPEPGDTLH